MADLGDLGEDEFARWCTLDKVLATKSAPDRLGWDFFVEFELPRQTHTPLDSQNNSYKALVQVKSTRSNRNSVRGKLSAFKRLVDTDLPAFIAYISYTPDNAPQFARLLHIGDGQIAAILKKIRKSEKAGMLDINRVAIELDTKQADELMPDRPRIRDIILKYVEAKQSSYTLDKESIRRTCGYDAGSVSAQFSFSGGNGAESLVDLMIGKVPKLEVSNIVITKARFGIVLDNDIDYIESAVMKVDLEPHDAMLIADNKQLGRRAEIPASIYLPSLSHAPSLPRKARVANDFFDFIMDFDSGRIGVQSNIEGSKSVHIGVLANALSFGILLCSNGTRLEIRPSTDLSSIRCSALSGKLPSLWRTACEFLRHLSVALLKHRGTVDCNVSFEEILNTLQENENMFALLTREGLELTCHIDPEDKVKFPDRGIALAAICIEFNRFAYVAVVQIECHNEFVGGNENMNIRGKLPEIVFDNVVDCDEHRVEYINSQLEHLRANRKDNTSCLITLPLDGEGAHDVIGAS